MCHLNLNVHIHNRIALLLVMTCLCLHLLQSTLQPLIRSLPHPTKYLHVVPLGALLAQRNLKLTKNGPLSFVSVSYSTCRKSSSIVEEKSVAAPVYTLKGVTSHEGHQLSPSAPVPFWGRKVTLRTRRRLSDQWKASGSLCMRRGQQEQQQQLLKSSW
jgi:hypothetical protein